MTAAIPIRPEIEPALDVEREMLDYMATKLREYVKEHGEPHSIAFVLVGQNCVDSMNLAYSWSPKDEKSQRLHTCAVAAAMLMKRATG